MKYLLNIVIIYLAFTLFLPAQTITWGNENKADKNDIHSTNTIKKSNDDEDEPEVTMSLVLGLNMANTTYKIPGATREAYYNYNGGIYVNYNFNSKFALQGGFLTTQKGDKQKKDDISYRTKLHYAEIPINAIYKLTINENFRVLFNGGPYIAYAFSGVVDKTGGSFYDVESINFTSDKKDFKRLDYGLNFGAAFEVSRIYTINLNYGLGLNNVKNNSDAKMSHRVLSLGFGVRLYHK